jgi:hypothetical protein
VISSSHVRGLTAFIVALGLAAAPMSAPAAQPAAAPLPDYVTLEVADSVIETDLVRTWASEAVTGGLGDAKIDAAANGRTLAVTINGTPFAYDVTVGVKDGGDWIGDLRSGVCKCDDTQLVSRVRSDVAAVAGRLQPGDAPPVVSHPTTPASPDATADKRERVPLGGKGKAGVALLVLGAGGVIAGAVLLGMGSNEEVASDDPSATETADLRPPGAAVLATGGVLVVAGAVLLGLDRRDAKRKRAVAIAPSAGRTTYGFAISGRF